MSISGGPATPTTDDNVDLTCLPGNGDSPITYQWVDVADDGVTLSMDAIYTATVSGSVTYRCTATNELGMDSAEVTVVEAGEFLVMISYIIIALYSDNVYSIRKDFKLVMVRG